MADKGKSKKGKKTTDNTRPELIIWENNEEAKEDRGKYT